jgi:CheY-like chemotaxis protein
LKKKINYFTFSTLINTAIVVFLIDDDEDDREVFEIALNEITPELSLCTAKNGYEALLKLKTEQNFAPDFIFLDLNMPQMNGWECLTEIRKISRFDSVPVIIYSTSFTEYDEAVLLRSGASGFVTKPTDIKLLSRILADVILKKKILT